MLHPLSSWIEYYYRFFIAGASFDSKLMPLDSNTYKNLGFTTSGLGLKILLTQFLGTQTRTLQIPSPAPILGMNKINLSTDHPFKLILSCNKNVYNLYYSYLTLSPVCPYHLRVCFERVPPCLVYPDCAVITPPISYLAVYLLVFSPVSADVLNL